MDTSIRHIFFHKWGKWERFPAKSKQEGWIKRCRETNCKKFKYRPLRGWFERLFGAF